MITKMTPDIINALFELTGGLFVLPSIFKIRQNKSSKGISSWTPTFFSTWGLWNLYYYPSLDQLYSFLGGIFLAASNLCYLYLVFTYRKES